MRDFLPTPRRQSACAASGARATRFADEPRRTMSAPGRRPCASPARDVEYSAYATASRRPLFASPHPTALQLPAATAHTDRRRMCSCRPKDCGAGEAPDSQLWRARSIPYGHAGRPQTACACPASGDRAVSPPGGSRLPRPRAGTGRHRVRVGGMAADPGRTAPASTGGMAMQRGVAHGAAVLRRPGQHDAQAHGAGVY